MDYIAGPEANAQSAEYFGEAPANAKACDLTSDKSFCATYHAARQGLRRQDLVLDDADQAVPRRSQGRHLHRLRPVDAGLDGDQGLTVSTSGLLHRRPGLRVGLLLAPPMLWLGVAYLGALAALFVTAFWGQNSFTGEVERTWTLDNFRDLFTIDVYRVVTLRTLGIAVAGDGAGRGDRVPGRAVHGEGRLAAARSGCWSIAVLMPLWASYLVKAYAWRGMLGTGGLVSWVARPFGLDTPGYGLTAVIVTLAYLWLPYMILPIFAGLERLPGLAARGVRRPRRAQHDHAAPGGAADGLPGDRGRLDLHVLADAG